MSLPQLIDDFLAGKNKNIISDIALVMNSIFEEANSKDECKLQTEASFDGYKKNMNGSCSH